MYPKQFLTTRFAFTNGSASASHPGGAVFALTLPAGMQQITRQALANGQLMMRFRYRCGQEIKAGDRIAYHGEPGKVEFGVTAKCGDPALDWFVNEHPGGGFMIDATGFGKVFLTASDIDEDLEFVSR